MKRLWPSINLLNIVNLIMIGLILAALIAGRFSGSAKGPKTSHANRATPNASVSR